MVRRLVALVRLARPPFLIGGFTSFALGAAVARFDGYRLDATAYVLGQAIVTAFHLMTHFSNDYFDLETDRHGTPTPWAGGSGVLPAGELPPSVALVAAIICAVLGLGATALAFARGAAMVGGLGLAIGALAWSYSAPPLRLLARGLGELDTIAVVAVLVPLTGYASFTGRLAAHVWLATLPCACAMFAMMLTVELPDIVADAATGKRNLVVRWGIVRATRVARALAATTVTLLVAVGVLAFAPFSIALLAALPIALLALAYAQVDRLRRVPFVSAQLLGVGLYGTTTLAALGMVVAR